MSRLDERTGEELVSLVPGVRYREGSVLIRQGARDMQVYLLESASPGRSACVKVTACLENGQKTLLGIGVSGDVVGEQAVLGQRARSATVVACSPLVAHPIPGCQFMDFLSRRPEAWHALALMITERLDWADRRRLSFAGHGVRVHCASPTSAWWPWRCRSARRRRGSGCRASAQIAGRGPRDGHGRRRRRGSPRSSW